MDAPFAVRIESGLENLLPGTETLHYRYDPAGAFMAVPLTPLGGDLYEATLPATNCLSQPEFYVSAQDDQGGTMTKPASAVETVFAAEVETDITLFADTFESDQGWLAAILGASSGQWQRGVPVNDPNWDYDPVADADGSGQSYLTQNESGNTDVDGGGVRLTSPSLNLAGGDAGIAYDYYLYLTEPGTDELVVEISSNDAAGPWTQVALHNTDGGTGWRYHEVTQADLTNAGVVLTSAMRVRFTVTDAEPQSIVEAGIDGFRIVRPADCNPLIGDFDGDGSLDLGDHGALAQCLAGPDILHPPGCQVFDAEADADVDLRDVAAFANGFALP
jgi:hypothetical protein